MLAIASLDFACEPDIRYFGIGVRLRGVVAVGEVPVLGRRWVVPVAEGRDGYDAGLEGGGGGGEKSREEELEEEEVTEVVGAELCFETGGG